MLANYDDVLGQLRDAGLILDGLDASGRMVRCKVEGSRERRGWYVLHELHTNGTDVLIVGTYGIWRGNDNGAIKVELRKRDSEFTAEQREALKRRLAEDRRRAEARGRTRTAALPNVPPGHGARPCTTANPTTSPPRACKALACATADRELPLCRCSMAMAPSTGCSCCGPPSRPTSSASR